MNLIICLTPLQALIAERIIDKHRGNKFIAVVLAEQKANHKYNYSYQRLKKKTKRSYFFEINFPFGLLLLLLLLLLNFINIGFKKIYVANINNVFIQVLLDIYKSKSRLYTFDDGTANIDTGSFLYKKQNINQNKIRKCILTIFNVKLNLDDIKSRIIKHYTIYNDLPNIVEAERLIYLPLFEQEIDVKNPIKAVKIFLGQPIFNQGNDCKQKNIEITQKAIKLVDVKYYLPHPRENYFIDGIEYIETELIAETYLLDLLKKHKNVKYEIYSFFSTSLINLMNIPNVQVKAIKFSEIPEVYVNTYKMFEKVGIEVI